MEIKVCTVCGVTKSLSEFYSKKRSDYRGYDAHCKDCDRARKAAIPVAVRNAKQRDLYARRRIRNEMFTPDPTREKICTHCGVRKTEVDFQRNLSNSTGLSPVCHDCDRQWRMDYYHNGPGQAKAVERRKAIRLIRAERDARAKAIKLGAALVDVLDYVKVWEVADGACYLCGLPVGFTEFEVDHVVALVVGGDHTYANSGCSHPLCNRRKFSNAPTPEQIARLSTFTDPATIP